MSIFFFLVVFVLGCPIDAFAWGGLEHTAIASAAVGVLSKGILGFLGAEAVRLIKVYCNYPDFNWAIYGTCDLHAAKKGAVRIPDLRRDWNASLYCQFDQFTGRGKYYLHGPEIGIEGLPIPDERVMESIKAKRFGENAVEVFFIKAYESLVEGKLREGIRFAGVAIHYLQDSTPPPHVLPIEGGSNPLHAEMEKIENRELITIEGYRPVRFGSSLKEAGEKARELAVTNSLSVKEMAYDIKRYVEKKEKDKAQELMVECAKFSARATADVITTLYHLIKERLPVLPISGVGVNILENFSFEKDSKGDGFPDSWVREWYDLSCCYDMHMWDKASPRSGKACAKLYGVSERGASWRTCWASSVPVREGEQYTLDGWIRTEGATGENYLALLLSNAEMETIKEEVNEKVSGTNTWQKLSVTCKIPMHVVDVRAACISKNNLGAVLFDDLELKRTE